MRSPAHVTFLSPSAFLLDGPGVRAWRVSSGLFIEGAEHSKLYKKKLWDGMYYPGEWEQNTGRLILGRGLIERIFTEFDVVQISDPPVSTRPTEIPLSYLPNFDTLRDYQVSALKAIIDKKWGRIGFPTNAGKGAIIGLSAMALSRSGYPVIILCDEIAVFQALIKEIDTWTGAKPSIVNADPTYIPESPIVLAMIPTLYARCKPVVKKKDESDESFRSRKDRQQKWMMWLSRFEVALLDEADKASAASWKFIMQHLENTQYRIGFSGTFFDEKTSQELVLQEFLGPVIMRLRNAQMIERKISARPFVELVPFDNSSIELPPKGTWRKWHGAQKRQWIYEHGVVHNRKRHYLISQILDPNAPNAIIVNYIQHGRELAATIPNSCFLHGDDDKEVRETVLAAYKKGDFQNLIVSKILDRGTNDLGHAVGLIFASGQGSLRQTLQRIGRGLRRTGGKEFLFLRDVIDRGSKYFETAGTKRITLYNDEGFEVSIRAEVPLILPPGYSDTAAFEDRVRELAGRLSAEDEYEDPTLAEHEAELGIEEDEVF